MARGHRVLLTVQPFSLSPAHSRDSHVYVSLCTCVYVSRCTCVYVSLSMRTWIQAALVWMGSFCMYTCNHSVRVCMCVRDHFHVYVTSSNTRIYVFISVCACYHSALFVYVLWPSCCTSKDSALMLSLSTRVYVSQFLCTWKLIMCLSSYLVMYVCGYA